MRQKFTFAKGSRNLVYHLETIIKNDIYSIEGHNMYIYIIIHKTNIGIFESKLFTRIYRHNVA